MTVSTHYIESNNFLQQLYNKAIDTTSNPYDKSKLTSTTHSIILESKETVITFAKQIVFELYTEDSNMNSLIVEILNKIDTRILGILEEKNSSIDSILLKVNNIEAIVKYITSALNIKNID